MADFESCIAGLQDRNVDKFKLKRCLTTLHELTSNAGVSGCALMLRRGATRLPSKYCTCGSITRYQYCHPALSLQSSAAEQFYPSILPCTIPSLAHSAEGVREAAVALLTRGVEVASPGNESFSTGITALLGGLGQRAKTGGEAVEEIRLATAKLSNAIVALHPAAVIIRTQLQVFADIVAAGLGDSFPSVKVEAAVTVMRLAAALPDDVHLVTGQLTRALLPLLSHQRGPVRLAALEALQALLPLGGESLSALLDETVLPTVQLQRFDRLVSVRKQLCVTLSKLLAVQQCREAIARGQANDATSYAVACKLLFMLCGALCDETPEVSNGAWDALAGGAQAVFDAPAHSSSSMARDVGDLAVAAEAADTGDEPGGGVVVAPSPGSGVVDLDDDNAPDPYEGLDLPHPFNVRGRATPSMRKLVRTLLPGALPLALAEAGDWAGHVRVASCGALRSLVIIGEAALANVPGVALSELATGLCYRVRGDEEEAAARKLCQETCRLLGAVAPPQELLLGAFMPILGFQSAETDVAKPAPHCPSKAAALSLLASALSSIPHGDTAPHLGPLASVLALPSLCYVEDELSAAGGDAGPSGSITGEPAGQWRDRGADVRLALAQALHQTARATASALLAEAAAASPVHALHGAVTRSPPPTHVPDAVIDDLLAATLHAQWRGEDDGEGAAWQLGSQAAHLLSAAYLRRLRATTPGSAHSAGSPVELFAQRAHSLLPRIAQTCLEPASSGGATRWEVHSPGRREFGSLLRLARPALAGRTREEGRALLRQVVDVFTATLDPASCSPQLRIAQLALLDSFLLGGQEEGEEEQVGSSGGGNSDEVARLGCEFAAMGGDSHAQLDTPASSHRRPSLSDMQHQAGVLPPLHNPPASLAFGSGEVGAVASPDALTLPLAADALPAEVRRVLDVAPSLQLAGASSEALRSALSGTDAAHTVSDVTVDDILAEEVALKSGAQRDGIPSLAAMLALGCLLPQMTWRVGGVAGTLRKVATATLVTALQRRLLRDRSLDVLIPRALPTLIACSSDDESATRQFAVLALVWLLKAAEPRGTMQPHAEVVVKALLARLDDDVDAVRLAVCEALGAAVHLYQPSNGTVDATDAPPAPAAVTAALLLHLDDPSSSIRDAAFAAVGPWALRDPAAVGVLAQEAAVRHQRPELARQLADLCVAHQQLR